MILIISHRLDFTTDFVVNILNDRAVPYRRFNCEDILENDVNVEIASDFSCRILGETRFDSVWFRRTKLPDVGNLPISDQRYLLVEFDNFLKNLFATIDATWLSDPFLVYRAENKIYQLKAARQVGFQVPETLVTTSKDELRKFYAFHRGDLIVKPISQTRVSNDEPKVIFTNLLKSEVMDQIDQLDLTPCIFQRRVPKSYELRVTVVGDNVFAAAVDSQSDEESSVDWRRKRLRFVPYQLPSVIKNQCVVLLKLLGLGFGAIDLIYTPDNEYVFLEINPNGQWVWIETETSLKISDAIINYLLDSKKSLIGFQ